MQSNEEKTRIQKLLLDMFSSTSRDDVLAICEKYHWNTENCIESLLTGESAKKTETALGAIPKCVTKVSKTVLGDSSVNSLPEEEIIKHIRLGYRVMVIMRGAPGSGKSSLARSILQKCYSNLDGFLPQDFIMGADDYFYDQMGRYEYKIEKLSEAHAFTKKRVMEKVAAGWSPIFIDNTNMQIWEMVPYVKIALQNGYLVEILEPRTPWKNSPAKLASKNSHGVPRDKIQRMLNKYENTTISDIIKSFKDVNTAGSILKMRNVPILGPMAFSKSNNYIPTETLQPKKQQNDTVQNVHLIKNSSEKENEVPKGQRNQFSKKTTTKSPSEISNGLPTTEETNIQPQEKLLEMLREPITNDISENNMEETSSDISPQKTFERHTVDCPNENQVFALLRRVYDNKSISGLWDLFLKCNGNVDWAVDILLKEDELNPIDDDSLIYNKVCDTYECNCGKDDLVLKEDKEEPKKFHIVNDNIQSQNVYHSNIRSQMERHKAKEDIEKKIIFSEEHYRKPWRRDNVCNFPSTAFQTVKELVDTSTQTDIFEERDNDFYKNEIVEIDFDENIVNQLNAIFQSEVFESESPMLPENMSATVFLPRTLAKDLYMLYMEAFYNKMQEERQRTLREDENFAKLIQNLEYEGFAEKPPDDQDSNDLKMALELLGQDLESQKKIEILQRNPMDLASHLTLLKLSDEFPQTPSEILLDILQIHNNNYHETVKVLLDNKVESELVLQKALIQREINSEKPATNTVDIPKRIAFSTEEAKRLELTKFEESRNLAVHHCQLKGECYQKAKEMIQKGNSAVAVYYSHIANMHKRKIEMYNQCAANSIIEVHKYSKNNPELLDLHYLHVAEAVGSLDLFLDGHVSNLRNNLKPYKHVFIITGRGLHSHGGVSAIKNKVKSRLKERNLRWSEVNPGLLKVKLFSTSRIKNILQTPIRREINSERPATNTVDIPNRIAQEAKRLELSKFEESRNLAEHHCQLKGEFYQKQMDFKHCWKGNNAVAVCYSHIANMHKRKIKMYNQCAVNPIVGNPKHAKYNPEILDVHYLHLPEAVSLLDLFLDGHVSNLRNNLKPYKHVFIITGRGLHSHGGVSAIKNKVTSHLKQRNLRWSEVNPGHLKVKLFSTSKINTFFSY